MLGGTSKAVILDGALKKGEPWAVGSIPAASNSYCRESQVFDLKKTPNVDRLRHPQKRVVFSGDSGGWGSP